MPTRRRLKCAVVTAVAPAVVTATVLVAPATAARAASTQAVPSAPAAIVLSVASGPVGTPVTVTGTGFAAKKAAVVAVGSTTKRITTTATGRFTAAVTIPRTSLSTIRITATAGTRSAGAAFTVTTAKSSGSARLGTSAPAPTTAPAPTPAPAPTSAPTSSAAPAPATSSTAPAASTAPAISSARLRLGLSTPGGPTANGELDAASATLGESPSIVMSHVDFTHPAPISGLQSVAARGADSLITWEPWQGGAGVDQAAYTNARIIAGDQDAYIRSWGTDLAKYGKTVYLRYGHEMNGNWYPWSDGVNGNASGSYVQAWKHVHDLVVAQGATNVKWVWSPNVPYPGSTDLASLYPGADQVDVVALDGYNWGAVAGQRWTAPADLFGPGIAQLRAVAPGKPLIIGEVASSETGGSKAAWDTDLVAYLQAQPDVLGFVWFDFQKEADWRIDSSAASATALREALALRRG
ncbi:endoglucanase [Clavibacter michiganensis subsp. michiganensis]|uniref:glycoside hydrolase family 26 protein n=1 Tax=Clavibacter michiganensis TaxID=28447 RepID=UPI000B70A164|nr:glycosyl hydrolase [Clavibacter michiganensis]MWJ18575.1 endoglucanase [Clavibacter michiganensis subsp. michiganensis]OUD97956.1 Endoglucanase H precursor [Clavibacter michiganensis subsp. michiganensis]OUE01925.1 Endoglucanase H precursor [Clavibacter michiganensis subsp. michiganensis]